MRGPETPSHLGEEVGRGRGGYPSSIILAQNARGKLIAQDISNNPGKIPEKGDTHYNEWKEFLKQRASQNDSGS